MWSVCVSDVVSVVGTVASLIHCCKTICMHTACLVGLEACLEG